MNTIPSTELENIVLQRRPILDVRAEVEFSEGHIPFSVCIPILNDNERAQVGTIYKQRGQEKAIELGHELVQGQIKEQRIQAWKDFLLSHENSLITCFRGGLRSRTAQEWLQQAGVQRPRLQGGYKAFRQYLIQQIDNFSQQQSLTVIGGNTGSAKTHLLRQLQKNRGILDLELYANHRGSAFGSLGAQPSQANFENKMAYDMVALGKGSYRGQKILIEDESRLIGHCVQPKLLFEKLRQSPVILVEENLDQRTENTFQDYIVNSPLSQSDVAEAQRVFEKFKISLKNISRRLGGLRFEEVLKDIQNSQLLWQERKALDSNKIWIKKLLQYYYDPMYTSSMQKREPKILFRGSRAAAFEYLQSFADQES